MKTFIVSSEGTIEYEDKQTTYRMKRQKQTKADSSKLQQDEQTLGNKKLNTKNVQRKSKSTRRRRKIKPKLAPRQKLVKNVATSKVDKSTQISERLSDNYYVIRRANEIPRVVISSPLLKSFVRKPSEVTGSSFSRRMGVNLMESVNGAVEHGKPFVLCNKTGQVGRKCLGSDTTKADLLHRELEILQRKVHAHKERIKVNYLSIYRQNQTIHSMSVLLKMYQQQLRLNRKICEE